MYIHTYGNLSNYICKLNAGNAIAELKGIPVLKINTYFQAALRKTITNLLDFRQQKVPISK